MKLQIKVIPSSSRDSIAGWLEDVLKIKVQAPPEKGKANKSVIRLLEKTLQLSTGSVEISSGTTSSSKIIEIHGVDETTIVNKLSAARNR
jgi:uncharacterized protein (TIGR00251 family)